MSELLLRKALVHAQEALHRACLVIGSTDGFRGDFDGINEALAIEPEYEWRACVADRFVDSDLIDSGDRSEPCGSREAAQACLADLVDTEPPYDEAWIERRVAVKAGPWERVE